MIPGIALGVLSARRVLGARIHASTIPARATIGAVVVGTAFDSLAKLHRIAFQARCTSAVGTMIMSVAFCVNSAGIADQARINTLAVVTLLIIATLIVGGTFAFEAACLRVSGIAWLASAHSVMVNDSTICIFSTQTWATAQAVDAGLGRCAIGIGRTLGCGCGGYGREQ